MKNEKEFEKYAVKHLGIGSGRLDKYNKKMSQELIKAGWVSPVIIEERQLNVAIYDVFSRLMVDRILFLGAPIDDDVANIIQAQLLFLESANSKSEISIYFNTPGGNVHAGLGIYDTMQYIEPEIRTICVGMAASMGAVLMCAGTEGKRLALPHSRIMIHQPMGGAYGQVSEVEITVKEMSKIKKELYEIISDHSGKDIKQVEKDADRDYWMTAREAKEYGMIDDVLTRAGKGPKKSKKK